MCHFLIYFNYTTTYISSGKIWTSYVWFLGSFYPVFPISNVLLLITPLLLSVFITILTFRIYMDILLLIFSSFYSEVWYCYSYLHLKRWDITPLFFKLLFIHSDNTTLLLAIFLLLFYNPSYTCSLVLVYPWPTSKEEIQKTPSKLIT